MRRSLSEQTVIFISILKWFVLATAVGIMVGFSTTMFLKALEWSTRLGHKFPHYFLLLPVALVASALIIKHVAPEAEGHGTEKVIEAIHKRSGKINVLVVPVKLLATVITIAAGGSVGKEGPCAQIGGGLASSFADLLRFDDNDRRKLVICGISAGFASVFGTPIAGAIFGIEVLVIGQILYDVLLPSFVAGLTAYHVSATLGISYFHYPVSFSPAFTEAFFVKIILAGVFFGLCSLILIETFHWGKRLYDRIPTSAILKNLSGGVILILLTYVFSGAYLGLGLDTIQNCLQGAPAPWYAFLMKTVYTTITLNCGGSGGIVTPIFFIGSTAGALFARIFSLDPATLAVIGFVSLLAGAANTPIAASIMAVELFGAKIAPYAAIACVVSFIMTGHRSVYSSQLLGIQKSKSIKVEIGQVIEDVKIQVAPRRKSVVGFLRRIAAKLAEKKRSR